jgi:AcrR family transcriptional regulator
MTTRDRLIRAGLDLFHKHGIHPVALDRILRKAGVTKTTFYNHFDGKEEFTCAVLDRYGKEVHEAIRLRFDSAHVTQSNVKDHLMKIFDAWDQLFEQRAFRGCMLVGAAMASSDLNDPARKAAIKNKRVLLQAYEDISIRFGIKSHKKFAAQFSVLVDGALVARHLYGDQNEVKVARAMAEKLIDEALRRTAKRPRRKG